VQLLLTFAFRPISVKTRPRVKTILLPDFSTSPIAMIFSPLPGFKKSTLILAVTTPLPTGTTEYAANPIVISKIVEGYSPMDKTKAAAYVFAAKTSHLQ
jgi:hypothetical protein